MDASHISHKPVVKKAKNRRLQKHAKVEVEKAKLIFKSSENDAPEVFRCGNCFKTHFPNRKLCKWFMLRKDIQKDKNKSRRLRGGTGEGTSVISVLVSRAIESGKKHGINLVQGILNAADGNCAFDAVINNINHRKCYSGKLELSSIIYRQIWISELEMESSRYPSLGAGYTKEEQSENWNHLKHSGVYEVDFFGDLVIHAIAKGCHKNILIFNTSLEASDPIYVIRAEEYGGFADSDIPLFWVITRYTMKVYIQPVKQTLKQLSY